MAKSLIRAVLAQAIVQEILVAFKGVADRLPFMATLSPEERLTMPKTGRKRLAFVQKAAEVVRQNSGLCPKDFDGDRFVGSADLLSALMPVFLAIQKLLEGVDDTMLQVGSDSYTQALDVYDFVKRLTKRVPGLDTAKGELARLLKESNTLDPTEPRKPRGRKAVTVPVTTDPPKA